MSNDSRSIERLRELSVGLTKQNFVIPKEKCSYVATKIYESLHALGDKIDNHPSCIEKESDKIAKTIKEAINAIYYLHIYADPAWYNYSDDVINTTGEKYLGSLTGMVYRINIAIERNTDPEKAVEDFNKEVKNAIQDQSDHTMSFNKNSKDYTFGVQQ